MRPNAVPASPSLGNQFGALGLDDVDAWDILRNWGCGEPATRLAEGARGGIKDGVQATAWLNGCLRWNPFVRQGFPPCGWFSCRHIAGACAAQVHEATVVEGGAELAPVERQSWSFTASIAEETSAFLTEKVPPKPQQRSTLGSAQARAAHFGERR